MLMNTVHYRVYRLFHLDSLFSPSRKNHAIIFHFFISLRNRSAPPLESLEWLRNFLPIPHSSQIRNSERFTVYTTRIFILLPYFRSAEFRKWHFTDMKKDHSAFDIFSCWAIRFIICTVVYLCAGEFTVP